jgi:hypothetical protein
LHRSPKFLFSQHLPIVNLILWYLRMKPSC